MNVVRRGTVGVALFVSGVLSIPAVMMADNHPRTDPDVDGVTLSGAKTSASPGAGDPLNSSGAPVGLSGTSRSAFGSAVGAASTSGGASSPPAAPTTTGGAGTVAAARQSSAVVGVDGVTEGAVLSGQVQIHALVTGQMNVVHFALRGAGSLSYLSFGRPFLLAPNGLGLDTTTLPNGPYTLVVTPYDPVSGRAVRIDFRIFNPTGNILSRPLTANQSVSYDLR